MKKDVDAVIKIEHEVYKLASSKKVHSEEASGGRKRFHTIADLQHIVPAVLFRRQTTLQVDWLSYLRMLAPNDVHKYITFTSPVVITNHSYIEGVQKLFQSTKPRDLANYIILRKAFKFMRLAKLASQSELCIKFPLYLMCHSTSAIYVRRFFSEVCRR